MVFSLSFLKIGYGVNFASSDFYNRQRSIASPNLIQFSDGSQVPEDWAWAETMENSKDGVICNENVEVSDS